MEPALYILIFIIIVIFLIVELSTRKLRRDRYKTRTINEWSYTRYARFMGRMELADKDFDEKINTIQDLIVNQKYEDLNKIAELSNCTYEECIMKIMYLKNKRSIGDYYIDTVNKIIKECSPEDKKMLERFSPYIYNRHSQIDEIARKLYYDESKESEDKVYKELKYLLDKKLINGVIINEVDRKLIYYSIEKRKNEKDFISLNCPSCGAINDVNRSGKKRCEYCGFIIEDKTVNKY